VGGEYPEREPPWPGAPEPVCCAAQLARVVGDHIGVAFTGVSDADLLRLDTAVSRIARAS
jgi:hypothetical protein